MPRFADVAQPLYQLLTKKPGDSRDQPFGWTAQHTAIFDELRTILTSAPALQCPDFDKPFVVHTDASDFALGAVLSQTLRGSDGMDREHPIAYLSRVLNSAERNYDATQRECLAVVFAVKKWRHYLEGREFTVVTDHSALKWLFAQSEAPNQRLARWILHLQEFTFRTEHRPGVKHQNADALSRNVRIDPKAPDNATIASAVARSHWTRPAETKSHLIMTLWKPNPKRQERLTRAQLDDDECKWAHMVLQLVGLREQLQHASSAAAAASTGGGTTSRDSLTRGRDVIFLPDSVRANTALPRANAPQKGQDSLTMERWRQAIKLIQQHHLVLRDNVLCHRLRSGIDAPGQSPPFVPFIPVALRDAMLQEAHDSIAAGHPGENGTYQALRPHCYWPNISNDARVYVQNCHACQINRTRPSLHIPLLPLPALRTRFILSAWIL